MRIVVLNQCFFNESHVSRLRKLGRLEIYNDTASEEDAIDRIKNADIVILDQFVIAPRRALLESSRNLKMLALNTTSYSAVDLEFAKKRKIKVSNAPGFSRQSVAELAIGLMFSVNRKIALGDRLVRQEALELDPGNPAHQKFIGFDFKGKTLGVVGLGNIGITVARIGKSIGMNVVAYSRSRKNIPGIKMVGLEELVKASDVISIQVPLTPETKNLIGKKEIGKMKRSAILIIVSPPAVVDMKALYSALSSGKIYGAGIDMWGAKKDDPLLKLDNTVFTPHCGSFTKESFFENLPEIIISNVESFCRGKPINVVDG